MFALLHALGMFVADLFKSRSRLEAENLFLRHQLNVALRRAPRRLQLRGSDRAFLVWMVRLWPSLIDTVRVVQPETVLRWHRAGFRALWRWKSRKMAGRPKIERELRDLIQRMSRENPLWGASRIHSELLMLGFEVAQSTVSKYIARGGKPPSQTWKTFLRNHADAIAAIDICVVPTLTFDRLFAFLVLGHGRRQLLWFEVTRHPTAEWLARQITEAFPLASAPGYLVRDNDRVYGQIFTARVRAMGIRDRPISPGSPWQNGIAERLIRTLRRECLDQIVVFGEAHSPDACGAIARFALYGRRRFRFTTTLPCTECPRGLVCLRVHRGDKPGQAGCTKSLTLVQYVRKGAPRERGMAKRGDVISLPYQFCNRVDRREAWRPASTIRNKFPDPGAVNPEHLCREAGLPLISCGGISCGGDS
jgi:transposase InsO family protein